MIITRHANERFNERWPNKNSDSIQTVAKLALRKGKRLNKSLTKTITLLGFSHSGYWTATHKVYRDFLFVFQKNQEGIYTFQTLYPLKYLKKQRKRMIMRHLRRTGQLKDEKNNKRQ